MATSNVPAVLIRTEEITEKFKMISGSLPKFEAISKAVKVNDDESLAVAENNASDIRHMLKVLENSRKNLKEPYAKAVKTIDSYAKTIFDQLEDCLRKIAIEITNYKTVQEAQKRAEMEAERKRLEAIEKEKTAEAERLSRLMGVLHAKLYGGEFANKNGEVKIAPGCNTHKECDELSEVIHKSFPKKETFAYLGSERDRIYLECTKLIRSHKINLTESQSEDLKIRDAALQRIANARKEAGLQAEESMEKINRDIAKETSKVLKNAEKEVKEAAQGTRKILKFRVVDEAEVPRRYLSVDESKIRAWMEGQSSDIKKQLHEGNQPISGVEFYVESILVTK